MTGMLDDEMAVPDRDRTLSERVASATTWEGALRAEDGAFLVELSLYRVDDESELPRASFDRGPIGMLKRMMQRRPVQSGRTVPRRRT